MPDDKKIAYAAPIFKKVQNVKEVKINFNTCLITLVRDGIHPHTATESTLSLPVDF